MSLTGVLNGSFQNADFSLWGGPFADGPQHAAFTNQMIVSAIDGITAADGGDFAVLSVRGNDAFPSHPTTHILRRTIVARPGDTIRVDHFLSSSAGAQAELAITLNGQSLVTPSQTADWSTTAIQVPGFYPGDLDYGGPYEYVLDISVSTNSLNESATAFAGIDNLRVESEFAARPSDAPVLLHHASINVNGGPGATIRNHLVQFDPLSGQTLVEQDSPIRIGPNNTSFFGASAFTYRDSDQTLFATLASGSEFGTLDLQTAQFHSISTTSAPLAGDGIAINPVDEQLWGVRSHDFNRLDPTTGSLQESVEIAGTPSFHGLAFTSSGVPYAVASDGVLYEIDLADGTATAVGQTGIPDPVLVEDLAITHDGRMFATHFHGKVFEVDLATGAAQDVTDTDFLRESFGRVDTAGIVELPPTAESLFHVARNEYVFAGEATSTGGPMAFKVGGVDELLDQQVLTGQTTRTEFAADLMLAGDGTFATAGPSILGARDGDIPLDDALWVAFPDGTLDLDVPFSALFPGWTVLSAIDDLEGFLGDADVLARISAVVPRRHSGETTFVDFALYDALSGLPISVAHGQLTNVNFQAVPEPSSATLAVLALLVVGGARLAAPRGLPRPRTPNLRALGVCP